MDILSLAADGNTEGSMPPRTQGVRFWNTREQTDGTALEPHGNLQRGTQDAGDWAVTWDGRNRGGRAVAPGLYFVRIAGPGIDQVRTVLVTK